MSMEEGAKNVIENCLNVKKKESMLILCDNEKNDIANAFFNAGKDIAEQCIKLKLAGMDSHGKEPPISIARLMKEMDVIVILTKYSISHTMARKRANKAGARIVSMPGITEDVVSDGGLRSDYKEIQREIKRIHRKLKSANNIRITTPLETDLELVVKGRNWFTEDTGLCDHAGEFTNLPAGEIFVSPVEESTAGTLYVDGSFQDTLSNPVKVDIKDGFATRVTGAKDVVRNMNKGGKNGRNVAKFGIGLNPRSKIIGNPLEDIKVLGTINIVFGGNAIYGGSLKCPVNIPAVVKNPTVAADNIVIIRNGELKI